MRSWNYPLLSEKRYFIFIGINVGNLNLLD
jgi:hypothetical protein